MFSEEERRNQLELYFSKIVFTPGHYADSEYWTLSVCLFYIFWGYVIVMLLSSFYHCHRVLRKVRQNRNGHSEDSDIKMEEMNHHEYGIDSSIWRPSPSSVSRLREIQTTDLIQREETLQVRRFPEKRPKRSASARI